MPEPTSEPSASSTAGEIARRAGSRTEDVTAGDGSDDGTDVDVVVLGGGPAGLAGAVTLARSLRSVVVVDAGQPRNAPADGVHNVLGHEGIRPLDLLAAARAAGRGGGAVRVLDLPVRRLRSEDGTLRAVVLGGTEKEVEVGVDAVVVTPRFVARADLSAQRHIALEVTRRARRRP